MEETRNEQNAVGSFRGEVPQTRTHGLARSFCRYRHLENTAEVVVVKPYFEAGSVATVSKGATLHPSVVTVTCQ